MKPSLLMATDFASLLMAADFGASNNLSKICETHEQAIGLVVGCA
jgi:hypothetical protein